MNKQTSANISHLAGIILNAKADGNETPDDFARLLHDAKIVAGSCLSQDETPGQAPRKTTVAFTFIDRKFYWRRLSGC
jgi:hypothetical protein